MAADDARRVLRIPARISFGCTDLTAAWPHGGTGLGATRQVVLIRTGGAYPVTAEAFGGEPVEYLEPGEVWGVGFTLRTFVDDALDLIFPNTAAGTNTSRQVISAPGTVRAGNWASGRGVVLVITPEGATQAKSATAPDVDAPFVVLHKAIPMIEESARMMFENGSTSPWRARTPA